MHSLSSRVCDKFGTQEEVFDDKQEHNAVNAGMDWSHSRPCIPDTGCEPQLLEICWKYSKLPQTISTIFSLRKYTGNIVKTLEI